MHDSTTSTRNDPARPTSWWRLLWEAASAGPASPVLPAMAGPNGALLWPGAARVLDALSPRAVADLHADVDPTPVPARPGSAVDPVVDRAVTNRVEDLCRAA